MCPGRACPGCVWAGPGHVLGRVSEAWTGEGVAPSAHLCREDGELGLRVPGVVRQGTLQAEQTQHDPLTS